jgi:hypothetical protein
MGFRTGAFCKVWDVDQISDRKVKLRVSISQKQKDGEYLQDFSDFPVCLGSACANQASRLKRGDVIKLGDVDVSNRYDKEKKVTYYDFKIFSFEKVDSHGSSPDNKAAPVKSKKPVDDVEPEADDAPLPF